MGEASPQIGPQELSLEWIFLFSSTKATTFHWIRFKIKSDYSSLSMQMRRPAMLDE